MATRFGGSTPQALAIAASAAVAVCLLVPLPQPEAVPAAWALPHLDKLVHALLFGALSASWWWAAERGAPGRQRRPLLLLALVAYGALLEMLQGAFFGRSAELGDVAADALGAGLALGLLRSRQPAGAPDSPR